MLSVAGAFAGDVDGDNSVSQLNNPSGVSLDATGDFLVIADRGNNKVKLLRISDLLVSTLITNNGRLNQPISVAVDRTNDVYVVNQGTGTILKFDRSGNFRTNVFIAGLSTPTALAFDAQNRLYISELRGRILRVAAPGTPSAVSEVLTNVANLGGSSVELRGIAVLDNNSVVVTDSANHAVWIWRPNPSPSLSRWVGLGQGFADGGREFARFNQPYHIARGQNGSAIVADRGNHRIRAIACDGSVSTVYGIDPALWEPPAGPGIFPGWVDGSADVAEAREPYGVAVRSDGTIFASESFYHLIRQADGFPFPSACGTGGGGGTPGATNLLATPRLDPTAGYFPMGVTVSVDSSDSDEPYGTDTFIFYTTDGTAPTTNSPSVRVSGSGAAQIKFRDSLTDLTSLRVMAGSGTNVSVVVSGQPVTLDPTFIGEVGIPRGIPDRITGGSGATVILPVVVNLRPERSIRSLQFLLEVTPVNGAPSILAPRQVRVLPMSPADFVPVQAASFDAPTTISSLATNNGVVGNRLLIAYVGTNQTFAVQGSAVVAMLGVDIPPGASSASGHGYRLSLSRISATTDAGSDLVSLKQMADQVIGINTLSYLVGDSSPGFWYNAGDFGNNDLFNDDVNNAFYASFGFRTPFPQSDVFNSMDVFPEDSPPARGGDGQIRFIDWQLILRRSVGLSPNNYRRFWNAGTRESMTTGLPSNPLRPAEVLQAAAATDQVWARDARLEVKPVAQVNPGATVEAPVFLRVAAGRKISGLQFLAYAQGASGAPRLEQILAFKAAAGVPAPRYLRNSFPSAGTLTNAVLCAWDIGQFDPPLEGTVQLGSIVLKAPATASAGQSYEIYFSDADGSSDDFILYDFESVRSSIWIGQAAPEPHDPISDEWKLHFFGDVASPSADPGADIDGDRFTNLAEFLAGTDPKSFNWSFKLSAQGFVYRWFGEAGKVYRVEKSPDLRVWNAASNEIQGGGALHEFLDTQTNHAQFYRVQIVR